MKIILALVIMHCQSYFDYQSCVETTMECIEVTSQHKPFPTHEPQVLLGEQELKMARAYRQCTHQDEYLD